MTELDRVDLEEDVKQAEGFRAKAYRDSVGVWTVGYGTNLEELTVDPSIAVRWLRTALATSEREVTDAFDWYGDLSSARQRALIEMAYNMGLPRLLQFRKMLEAIGRRDYDEAAAEMLNSRWADQVGVRAERLAAQMRDG